MKRMYVDPWRDDRRYRRFSQNVGDNMPYTVDFSASASARGTTVSSVEWKTVGQQTLTATSQALSSGIASAIITSTDEGQGEIKITATYADGNKEVVLAEINIEGPDL